MRPWLQVIALFVLAAALQTGQQAVAEGEAGAEGVAGDLEQIKGGGVGLTVPLLPGTDLDPAAAKIDLEPAEGSVGLSALSGLRVNVGRQTLLGRSPGDPRPTFGEVGVSIGLSKTLSLVPSYRLILSEQVDEERPEQTDHVLTLGAQLRF